MPTSSAGSTPKGRRALRSSRFVKRNAAKYDYLFFFSYRYYHAYHGPRAAPERAVLVPTAERDDAVGLSIFPAIFRGVRAIMYNSPEERAMIEAIAANHQVPSVVVGIGSELPANPQPGRFRQKFDIRGPFAIYVGRIDENKGCRELFAAFEEYVRNDSTRLSLVLIGNSMLPIPQHPRIRHLGFLDDGDKFDAIAASELLLMPSYFESLSMVALEAWALGRPVLANARCDVLKGQSIRSNAGLYYDNRTEFLETLRALESNRWLSATLGRNGRQFFREHYDWPVIERKYLDMIARLAKEPAGPGIEPPPGWLARHRKDRPPAREVVAALASGPAARSEPSYPSQPPAMRPPRATAPAAAVRRRSRPQRHTPARIAAAPRTTPAAARWRVTPAVHQVLATLGYGDAIGHEVLGIQRVLRAAGYESDIFVETAERRSRALDSRLSRAGRRQPSGQPAAPPLLDRIEGVADRLRAARSDGAHLSQHHAARVLRRRAPDARAAVLSRPAGAARVRRPRCDLALGDSEFNRQDLEALGFPRTAVLPVVPDFSHLDREPNRFVANQFDDDWTNILFVGRVIANKKIENVIRFFHAYHTGFNPRSRLIIVGMFSLFERYLAGLHHLVAELGLSHVHFTGHISDEELVAYYEIADLFLCASEHEGFCVPLVEAFYKQVPVLAYAATAVPATMDGAGVLFDGSGTRGIVARLMDAILSNPALQDAIVDGQRRGRAPAAGEGLRGHAARLRRSDPERAARAAAAGRAGLLAAVRRRRKRSTSCGSSGRRRSSACPALP